MLHPVPAAVPEREEGPGAVAAAAEPQQARGALPAAHAAHPADHVPDPPVRVSVVLRGNLRTRVGRGELGGKLEVVRKTVVRAVPVVGVLQRSDPVHGGLRRHQS